MLKEFGFRRKMYYLCTSEEEKALNTGVFSSFFWRKSRKKPLFYKASRKFYMPKKNFYLLLRIFFGPSWCTDWLFRKKCKAEIVKDIKVFGTKKFDFNISGNYSGQYYPLYQSILFSLLHLSPIFKISVLSV